MVCMLPTVAWPDFTIIYTQKTNFHEELQMELFVNYRILISVMLWWRLTGIYYVQLIPTLSWDYSKKSIGRSAHL